MTRILFAFVLLCLIHQVNYAQSKNPDVEAASIPEVNCTSVDALASYIKQNFTTDTARVRAIYVWIANHISYDVKRFNDRDKNPEAQPQAVANVLSTRKAVCQGYSDLFVALCKAVGINAIQVSGYTKSQGKVNIISHAWAAVELEGKWYFFDPTWGAGYVTDNDKFVKHFNNSFYKVLPEKFVVDHMPFDPLYEFLSYPLNNKEFIEGKPASAKTEFHYADTLKQHMQLPLAQQKAAELRRLEAAGIPIDLLLKEQQFLRKSLQAFGSNDAFDEGGKAFNSAMDLYKEYIGHKNKQFATISDDELKQMMENIEANVKLSRSLMLQAVVKTDGQRQARTNNVGNLDRFWPQLMKEKQFVQQYLSTEASARKQLFTRR
jgi:hypothetical protein